jgi:hypothetical protein
MAFACTCALAALLAGGCTTEKWARAQPPQDISAVAPGTTRAQVEALLGKPKREWTTPLGVRYGLYHYDGGARADPSMHLLSLITVLTFGMPELFIASDKDPRGEPGSPERARNVAVSFDANDVVIGVFRDISEFAALPADGVVPQR